MELQIISYNNAVLAKEKGFNEPCLNYYGYNIDVKDEIDKINICTTTNKKESNSIYKSGACSAPTQELLKNWLRMSYNIHLYIYAKFYPDETITYSISLRDKYGNDILPYYVKNLFDKYEEALEKGLEEGLLTISLYKNFNELTFDEKFAIHEILYEKCILSMSADEENIAFYYNNLPLELKINGSKLGFNNKKIKSEIINWLNK